MTAYVDAHFAEDSLSLQHLADHVVYMNADYIGREFTRAMGRKFSSYLLEVRMEHAKMLMATQPACTATRSQSAWALETIPIISARFSANIPVCRPRITAPAWRGEKKTWKNGGKAGRIDKKGRKNMVISACGRETPSLYASFFLQKLCQTCRKHRKSDIKPMKFEFIPKI